MYPPGASTRVRVGGVAEPLEGKARPGHFEGVATVVTKLFAAVQPDRAYFGQKDAQQVAVVKRLVRDLDLGVGVRVGETVREPDGVALSSRNVYLDPAERRAAAGISAGLLQAASAYAAGERRLDVLRELIRARLAAEPLVQLEYAERTDHDSSAAMTMDDYLHFEEEAFKTPNHGDIVDGIVARVDPDEVLVDIGAKAEGVISSKDLGLRGDVDSQLEPGDQIKVYVLQPENEEGNVVLSLRRARAETTWIVAAEKQTDGTVIDADVREQNKGGLIVNILGLRGFLPSSQVARAYAGSLESLVGKRIPVKDRKSTRLN